MGRKKDYLVNADGDIVYTVAILDIHYWKCLPKVRQYQIEQNEQGKCIFRVVKREDWLQEDEEELRAQLRLKKIEAYFEYVDDIPLTVGGKYRFLIQNIKVDESFLSS